MATQIVKPEREPAENLCDTEAADRTVALSHVDLVQNIEYGRNRDSSKIYIKDAWYLLSLDQKVGFDDIMQCYFTGIRPPYGERKMKGKVFTRYFDFRSGKVVATGGPPRLEMEQ